MPDVEREIRPGVVMRSLVPADARVLLEALLANRDDLDRWNPTPPASFYTLEGQTELIRQSLAVEQSGRLARWVLARRDRIVGSVSIFSIMRGALQVGTIGYWVDAGERGQGVATAAVHAAVASAREDLRLHRLEAGAAPENAASLRVLEKAGFQRIGLAPDYLLIGGAWHDQVLHQIILGDGVPPDNGT